MENIKPYENTKITGDNVQNPMQVFCHLRSLQIDQVEESAIRKRDFTTVVLASHSQHNRDRETQYVFKQVFDDDSNLGIIFDVVARPLVQRLIRGENSLLLMYGATSSTKIYSIAGRDNEYGFLPRCLKTLFETIDEYHAAQGTFQMDHLNGFDIREKTEINNYFETNKTPRSEYLRRKLSEIWFNLESIGPISPILGINEHNIYAVYVSYVEIYNNAVYDLLETDFQKSFQSHIVREDPNGNMYIHGVTELEVFSMQEAIEIFQIGQKRKHADRTLLNTIVGKSHCIFNIRLVQAPSKNHAKSGENSIIISQLSLVDLANNERSQLTTNTGIRLRETGNINNSIIKLRECMEYLRKNQLSMGGNQNVSKKISCRESKLTYLFKNFFEGEGQVSMVVCINPTKGEHTENVQALKFGEMIQEVQIVNRKPNANTTPLKRAACNKENSEPPSKKYNEYYQKIDSKSNGFNMQLAENQKKITLLEKQNLDLRLELAMLREAYETVAGKAWCNDIRQQSRSSIFATTRKPMISPQKSNIFSDSKLCSTLEKKSLNVEGTAKEKNLLQTAFQKELKERLQKQRLKLDQNLIDVCKEDEYGKLGSILTENNFEDGFISINKNYRQNMKPLELLLKQDMEEEEDKGFSSCFEYMSNAEEKNSYNTPKAIRMKFEQRIQMNVFPTFRMMLGKSRQNTETHSTHYERHTQTVNKNLENCHEVFKSNRSKSLPRNTTYQRDPDFDKREYDLSLKLKNHRNNRTTNNRLKDIIAAMRRPIDLFD